MYRHGLYSHAGEEFKKLLIAERCDHDGLDGVHSHNDILLIFFSWGPSEWNS